MRTYRVPPASDTRAAPSCNDMPLRVSAGGAPSSIGPERNIRTYVHTYIRTYVHTYIRTYIHTITGCNLAWSPPWTHQVLPRREATDPCPSLRSCDSAEQRLPHCPAGRCPCLIRACAGRGGREDTIHPRKGGRSEECTRTHTAAADGITRTHPGRHAHARALSTCCACVSAHRS